jgi:hypothetical protein
MISSFELIKLDRNRVMHRYGKTEKLENQKTIGSEELEPWLLLIYATKDPMTYWFSFRSLP